MLCQDKIKWPNGEWVLDALSPPPPGGAQGGDSNREKHKCSCVRLVVGVMISFFSFNDLVFITTVTDR